MASFVHLHNHSEFSLLDGLSKIKNMVDYAKKLDQPALAITDHGSMYGVIKFYKAAKEAGIKPIIGCEIYMAKRSLHDKEAGVDKEYNHLILLAENNQGYKNLMKIVSISNLEGYYYKPRSDLDLLKKYHEGLICLSACVNGYVTEPLTRNEDAEAEKRAKKLNEIFGQGNFFLEIQHHIDVPPQEPANIKLITLSKKLGIPLVATNDNHYTKKGDAEAEEILLCIQTQQMLDDKNRKLSLISSPDFYMKSEEEMQKLFVDTPEAIENAIKIGERCDVEITLGKWIMPNFTVPDGFKPDNYLRHLIDQRIGQRYNPVTEEIIKRIEYELEIIIGKGYETYFLTVQDFVSWAKEQHISVGPGRGSAAGSVVSYILGITDVDPFFFKLPFERFLNPLRPSAPDIDLDFADVRRDEVIAYVTKKYGEDKVAQIITFGTMEARGSVRDVGRVLGLPYAVPDRLSKMIPPGWQGHAMTIESALQQSAELKRAYDTEPETKRLLDLATKLEGVARHASVHAAGVVIADKPLTEYTPLQRESNGDRVVTQYDMYTVGEDGVGLLKMDFLGLRNLTIIEEALKFIKINQGVDIDISKLPLDDKSTYDLLSKAETTGIFQLESAGMRRYIKELKPTTIFDLQAMVALYRPGPMQVIPEFIKRKHNPFLITYPHPDLVDILKESYGVLTFQDDVLLTVIKLAGYTWLDADKFRKAMGKKIPAEMKKQEELFIKGCIKNGITEKKAKELFELIAPFAGYGFNKCITGDTIITNGNTGEQYTVEELYKKSIAMNVYSLTSDLKLESTPISFIQQNGIKTVYEIVTRRGLKIKASDNHPFLTFQGFRELKTLKVGNRIGTARKAAITEKPYVIKDYQLATLGYLLAEGNLCHPSGIYFYSTSQIEVDDFIKFSSQFTNAHITSNISKSAQAVYIGRKRIREQNSLFIWLKGLGLLNKKATNKHFPPFAFQLNKMQLSLLLAKMWQGDGSITPSLGGQIYYATSSNQLAQQMQHLLLRLGIMSTLHTKSFRYRGQLLPGYTINISRHTNIKAFAETIGPFLIGNKLLALKEIITTHPILTNKLNPGCARGSKDIIPSDILPLLQTEIYKSYTSLQQYAVINGMAVRLLSPDTKKIGFLRESIENIGKSLQSSTIMNHAQSDIYWDEIVEINKKQDEMTYDLTVPKTHNFVANDFIVHNSHAACYAIIAYRTAYLKAHYPVEFMTALLTAESRGTSGPIKNEKIAQAVAECKRLNVEVLPPHINKSLSDFAIEERTKVRFGLSAIKNVGAAAIETILHARNTGNFLSLQDFCTRVNLSAVNKKTLESLLKAGAFDSFGNRASLLIAMPDVVAKANELKKQTSDGQSSLFGDFQETENDKRTTTRKITIEDIEDFTPNEKLSFEKEFLGFYLTSHPQLGNLRIIQPHTTHEIELLEGEHEGSIVKIGGIIESIKRIYTKKTNAEMAFLTLVDEKGVGIECVIFPKVFDQYKNLLRQDDVVLVQGKLNSRDDKQALLVDRIISTDMLDSGSGKN